MTVMTLTLLNCQCNDMTVLWRTAWIKVRQAGAPLFNKCYSIAKENKMEENGAQKTDNNTQKTKVLIIGAGMAGLSAAYHLTKNGFTDFKVLEARGRIGGRIIQIPIGNDKIELGANWIHGVLGNPVYELAMQHGLVDIMAYPKPHKLVAATEQGKQVPFATLQEIYEAYLCFLNRCEEYFLSQYSPPDGIHSVGDHIKLEISLYLDKINDSCERHLRELLFECLLKRETCISGCDDMSEIDLIELGSYTELQGGNIILPKGYSSILEPLRKTIPVENLLTKHPVKYVKWLSKKASRSNSNPEDSDSDDSDRTVIESPSSSNHSSRSPSCEKSQQGSNVEIICDNGKRFLGDQVICTLPLGVLKHNASSIFQPPLPEYKMEAIDRLLFGTVDKIILEYERPFLHPNINEVLFLWDSDKDKTSDMSENWYKKIYSFAKISETLILGWISGKEAEYMETLPNEVIIEACTMILRKFLNDPFIPKPKRCVCTSWHSQPYTRGSYTAISVGSSQIDIEYLAQPIYADENETQPVLLFAGEHAHSNFYSTVHGAFLSGRTAAQLIMSSETPKEIVVDCEDATDLSSWIQGIHLG